MNRGRVSGERSLEKRAGSRRISDEAVRSKTGKAWREWFQVLDEWGAGLKGHKAMAKYLEQQHHLSGWWAQTVAVRYEWEQGRRALCSMQLGDRTWKGEALVEAGQLLFSSEEYRLVISAAKTASIRSAKGRLAITFPRGEAVFDLGQDAERWAATLRSASSVEEKKRQRWG